MPMSALRRLLSIAAVATGIREPSPREAAAEASSETVLTLSPPELTAPDSKDTSEEKAPKPT
jgi:hypothetical protein